MSFPLPNNRNITLQRRPNYRTQKTVIEWTDGPSSHLGSKGWTGNHHNHGSKAQEIFNKK